MSPIKMAYTVFQGRAGDPNDLAIPGAKAIGDYLARRNGINPVIVGEPEPALNKGWRKELDAAMLNLEAVKARFEEVFTSGVVSVAAISRCVVSLATLPVVAKYHPDCCIVWFDAHADLNTPETSETGYLGGLAFAGAAGLWDSGLGNGVRLDQIVLVGQRDLDPFETALISRYSIPYITLGDNLSGRLKEAIAGRAVYVHLDCDVLEPGIVPTDYKLESGMTLEDLKACSEIIAAHSFIGIEIAEFQNAWESNGTPASPSALLEALSPLISR
ncbi:arginase family protein [Pantoea sp. FN0302]|uniref:arginase family protein n=1 Tax=Pantoea TaxID=53335 RepID=UPI00202AF105|nr:arginase family protein [Pantoea alhagi]URQ60556.1 arginase family protein [Pantoea alhagi]